MPGAQGRNAARCARVAYRALGPDRAGTGSGHDAARHRSTRADVISRRVMRSLLLALVLLPACSGAGPYGYSRTYSALDAEEDAAEGAKEYDPVMAERDKSEWKKSKVSVFGIVNKRAEGPGGTAYVTLSVRTL